MPFIAKHRDTGERVDIAATATPRATLQPGKYICPLCGDDFIIRAGLVVAAHFAHRAACTSSWRTHPESAEHRAGKLFLVNNLPTHFDEYKGAEIMLEVPIPEIHRVADVLATTVTGWRIVHEVQLASITVEELESRTNDYHIAGLDVVWWLGGRAATDANRNWCLDVFGFWLCLDFHKTTGGVRIAP
jgi:competence protein CoiA